MARRGDKIRKRKDGRWEGRYKSGNDENGKTLYKSVYGHSYAEVKNKLESVIGKSPHSKAESVPILFKDAALSWLEVNHQKNKGATEAKYEFLIDKHIIPALGNYRVSDITTNILNHFCDSKLEGTEATQALSPSYVRSIMLLVTSIIDYAVVEKWCSPLNTPPFVPSAGKSEIRILQKSEQIVLEECLKEKTDLTKLGAMLSLYTGMRIGEVCALKWDDIDLTDKVINVRSTVSRVSDHSGTKRTVLVIDSPKTEASNRKIPIPDNIIPIIRIMSMAATSRFVLSTNDSFLSPRTYEYRFHNILKTCSIEQVNYHTLRHTFATRCIEVGVDVKTLSEILGHANVAITLNTYVHPSMDLKRQQINKLASISC